MNGEQRLGAIISFTICMALVVSIGIMASCSKSVSRTGSDAVEACIRNGGKWIGSNSGQAAALDFCSMPDNRK